MLSFLTKNRASRLLHTLLITPSCDLFFPPRCFICENRLTLNQKIVCLSCFNNIPLYHTPPQNPFPDKIFNRAYILFTFNQDIRLLIHLFKYKGYFTLADYFAETAIRIYPQLIQTRYDFVLPVPLHKTRYRERGFNQSTVLGRALANLINVDLNENLLIRHRNTPTQTHLDRRERQQNVASAFQCTAMLPDIRILIIDDVITTGSTLNACCTTLQKAGAAHVDVFALANPVLDKPYQHAEE